MQNTLFNADVCDSFDADLFCWQSLSPKESIWCVFSCSSVARQNERMAVSGGLEQTTQSGTVDYICLHDRDELFHSSIHSLDSLFTYLQHLCKSWVTPLTVRDMPMCTYSYCKEPSLLTSHNFTFHCPPAWREERDLDMPSIRACCEHVNLKNKWGTNFQLCVVASMGKKGDYQKLGCYIKIKDGHHHV